MRHQATSVGRHAGVSLVTILASLGDRAGNNRKAGRREARAWGSRATRHALWPRDELFRAPLFCSLSREIFLVLVLQKQKCALAFPQAFPPSRLPVRSNRASARAVRSTAARGVGACRTVRPRDASVASARKLRLGSHKMCGIVSCSPTRRSFRGGPGPRWDACESLREVRTSPSGPRFFHRKIRRTEGESWEFALPPPVA